MVAMTLFGKSLFETVLAGIDARKEEEEDADPSEPSIRGLNAGFVGHGFEYRAEEASDPTHLFEAFLPEPAPVSETDSNEPEPAEPELPDWLDRLSPEDVAADLALDSNLSRTQLQARRRQFARENHPDRVAPLAHEAATIRMMIANHMIDKALKSARS